MKKTKPKKKKYVWVVCEDRESIFSFPYVAVFETEEKAKENQLKNIRFRFLLKKEIK